ncbi:MAG: helix-turn-helix domain-containing protein [Roseburia sp.]|nr:helix-turn-helix domain-containing protein [Roseburia sp.]MCM1099244.1 helix-turn-helix domain-containing protein [Ruminococcus flavefaciens]
MLSTSRQTVSKWELDQTIPEIGKIVLISKLFSVTTDSILIDGISTFDLPQEQFLCGVYKSEQFEIVETEKFSLVYFCSRNHVRFGTNLYKGMKTSKRLCAACEYNTENGRIIYAYETKEHSIRSNDKEIEKLLGETFDRNLTKNLKRTETFFVNHAKPVLPTVAEAGIRKCLTLWRMSASYQADAERMNFLLCTGKTDYVFQIVPKDTNIYCGITYQVPFDFGILGGRQFFRIRNYRDNSKPWCQFFSHLGYECGELEVPVTQCELGKCVQTSGGSLLWGVKRYTDDEIVLQGCGKDEYFYYRNADREEVFSPVSSGLSITLPQEAGHRT